MNLTALGRWLAAVAQSALDNGGDMLAARTGLFLTFFCTQLSDKLVVADELDLNLSRHPSRNDADVVVCRAALTSAERLDPTKIVAENATVRVMQVVNYAPVGC